MLVKKILYHIRKFLSCCNISKPIRDAPVYKVMIIKIEAVPIVPKTLRTYIEAVPELETCIHSGFCYRGDQAACVAWVPSVFALCTIVSLLHGGTILRIFQGQY